MTELAEQTLPRLRRAARILLIDPDDRVLLFRYVVAGRAPFWCGPGGECDPGETFAAAARRELFEETGLEVADCGPERARRGGEFATLTGEWIRSDERFFVVHAPRFNPSDQGHTAVERAAQMTHRWFTRAELPAWPETIFPEDIATLLDELAPRR
ncbi:NUDIX domain-containing protein [Novosphingobium flavum]|uniref:NUDIX domain-containing protein n=1 Tax=Novosphingobium aerophilum TaxID=2839843 RepID=A0A7X1FAY9_9SPHN|nr:NUDIX domain-containing protein [Novosphingobium aerophilum]MBC2653642.1 NUDIX domain-containing protein [Novosphingobium aerophilum]MBC2663403.1 NUDIX domain-containing protein [Novosphingobium aerophilum]